MRKFIFTLLSTLSIVMPNYANSSTSAIAQTELTLLERNKANVAAFYDLTINQHKPEEAASLYLGSEYLQHNPYVADGAEAFVKAMTSHIQKNPQYHGEIKRMVAEGDLVILHAHNKSNPEHIGRAVIDIYRLDENGKIVEHWDVAQEVIEKTASGRGMF